MVLETPELSLSILAERGGKITSLFDRVHGREWLIAAEHQLRGPADEATIYDEGDLCGWDEMLPTIAPCRLPGTEIELADHGDLWRGAWDLVAASPSSIATRVTRELGYCFERTLSVEGASLLVDYRVTATGPRTLELLWAAHPFVALRPDTRLLVEGVSGFVEMTANGEQVPYDWPDNGVVVSDAIAPSTGRKIFARAHAERVSALLVDPSGATLTWSWASSDAPWLGLWLDHCSLSAHLVAVVEPTNAGDDSLEVASSRRQSWVLAPHEERRWQVRVSVSSDLDAR